VHRGERGFLDGIDGLGDPAVAAQGQREFDVFGQAGGDDLLRSEQSRSEIRSAAAEPGFAAALLSEYVVYYELAAELCTLRAICPLPPVRRMVVTAHTGWRTHRWRTHQIRLATALGGHDRACARCADGIQIARRAVEQTPPSVI
jgi:hypothetical protein